MRPEFKIAVDYYKNQLIKRGFSGNIKWLFRENLLVKKGNNERYKFILNMELNDPDVLVETIYNKLIKNNQEIFIYTFIKGENLTFTTIAGDDFDFEKEDGDELRVDWEIKFGFSNFWTLEKNEIQFQQDLKEWVKMKKNESKDIGPFDYFYLAEYFK